MPRVSDCWNLRWFWLLFFAERILKQNQQNKAKNYNNNGENKKQESFGIRLFAVDVFAIFFLSTDMTRFLFISFPNFCTSLNYDVETDRENW